MGRRTDWLAARAAYVEGVQGENGIEWPTLAEIAARFKCGIRAVELRSANENWPTQRTRFQARFAIKLREKKAEAMAHKAAQLDERFLEASQRLLALIERLQEAESAKADNGNSRPEGVATLSLAAQRAQKVAKIAVGEAADITRHELPRGEFTLSGGFAPLDDEQA
jgi:hypothetical protein